MGSNSTPRVAKRASARLIFLTIVAFNANGATLPPDLSPKQTQTAIKIYAADLQKLLRAAELDRIRYWSNAGKFKLAERDIQQQIDSLGIPFNVSDAASNTFSSLHDAAADVASDYIDLADDRDLEGEIGQGMGIAGDAAEDIAKVRRALSRDRARFAQIVKTANSG